MYKIYVGAFLVVLMYACGTQRQLQREFVGKSITAAETTFGEPTTVIDNDGNEVYIFEREEELESTEIQQGKFTLDPIVTPKVMKTERYYFTVEDGVVREVRFEEEYER